MKRITMMRIKATIWLIPFIVMCAPFWFLPQVFDKMEDACGYLRQKAERLSTWAGDYFMPPKWWPSWKIVNEVHKEMARIHKEKVDELHK